MKGEVNSPFEEVWARVKSLTGWKDYKDLAEFIGTSPQSVSGVKRRGKFPLEWARKIAMGYGLFIDYLLDGKGPKCTGESVFHPLPDYSSLVDPPPMSQNEIDELVAEREGAKEYLALQEEDPEIVEIVQILKHDVPEAKQFILMVLRGKKQVKAGLEGLGLKLNYKE